MESTCNKCSHQHTEWEFYYSFAKTLVFIPVRCCTESLNLPQRKYYLLPQDKGHNHHTFACILDINGESMAPSSAAFTVNSLPLLLPPLPLIPQCLVGTNDRCKVRTDLREREAAAEEEEKQECDWNVPTALIRVTQDCARRPTSAGVRHDKAAMSEP